VSTRPWTPRPAARYWVIMAIENENKYVLSEAATLEAALERCGAPQRIEQGYLDSHARIRRIDGQGSWFTYKRRLADQSNVEIETAIDTRSFDLLWRESGRRLRKHRFKLRHGEIGWDVDFFKSEPGGGNYFAMAECEMPEGMTAPPDIHPLLRRHILFAVPREDDRFRSYLLTDEAYAVALKLSLR
jgi:CYTH domain-containing protein